MLHPWCQVIGCDYRIDADVEGYDADQSPHATVRATTCFIPVWDAAVTSTQLILGRQTSGPDFRFAVRTAIHTSCACLLCPPDIREARPQARRRLLNSSKIHIFPTGQVDGDQPGKGSKICNCLQTLLGSAMPFRCTENKSSISGFGVLRLRPYSQRAELRPYIRRAMDMFVHRFHRTTLAPCTVCHCASCGRRYDLSNMRTLRNMALSQHRSDDGGLQLHPEYVSLRLTKSL